MATSTQYETLKVEHQAGVAVVTIDNPPMNVINIEMGEELGSLVGELAGDREVRSVLFRSATPGVFIAGADISLFANMDDELMNRFLAVADVFDRVAQLPQPTVCAIGGTCLGGGFEFALACDFRFMASGFGEIGLPEVRLGLLPGGGGTQRLPRLVGAGVATEMLLKGMRYDAAKALELGLLHQVVEPDQLDAVALKYATSLAAQAPMAVQHIKRLVRAAFETPAQGLELERELFREVLVSKDAKEGVTAFFEGRKPAFAGE